MESNERVLYSSLEWNDHSRICGSSLPLFVTRDYWWSTHVIIHQTELVSREPPLLHAQTDLDKIKQFNLPARKSSIWRQIYIIVQLYTLHHSFNSTNRLKLGNEGALKFSRNQGNFVRGTLSCLQGPHYGDYIWYGAGGEIEAGGLECEVGWLEESIDEKKRERVGKVVRCLWGRHIGPVGGG